MAFYDGKELEGLCDRVYVMSRGHIVETLEGAAISEERMVKAAVASTRLIKETTSVTTTPKNAGCVR